MKHLKSLIILSIFTIILVGVIVPVAIVFAKKSPITLTENGISVSPKIKQDLNLYNNIKKNNNSLLDYLVIENIDKSKLQIKTISINYELGTIKALITNKENENAITNDFNYEINNLEKVPTNFTLKSKGSIASFSNEQDALKKINKEWIINNYSFETPNKIINNFNPNYYNFATQIMSSEKIKVTLTQTLDNKECIVNNKNYFLIAFKNISIDISNIVKINLDKLNNDFNLDNKILLKIKNNKVNWKDYLIVKDNSFTIWETAVNYIDYDTGEILLKVTLNDEIKLSESIIHFRINSKTEKLTDIINSFNNNENFMNKLDASKNITIKFLKEKLSNTINWNYYKIDQIVFNNDGTYNFNLTNLLNNETKSVQFNYLLSKNIIKFVANENPFGYIVRNDTNELYDYNEQLSINNNLDFSNVIKQINISLTNYAEKWINQIKKNKDLDLSKINDESIKFHITDLINKDLLLKSITIINNNEYSDNTLLPTNNNVFTFDGFQLSFGEKNDQDKTNWINVCFKISLAFDANNNVYLKDQINNDFSKKSLFTNINKYNEYLNSDVFINDWTINLFKSIPNYLIAIDYYELPKYNSIQYNKLINNIDTLYAQKIIYHILQKDMANYIKNSGIWYPGKILPIKMDTPVNFGYLNGHFINSASGNPYLMFWQNYSAIVSSCAGATNYQNADGINNEMAKVNSYFNINNIKGHFSQDFFEQTPFNGHKKEYLLPPNIPNKLLASVFNPNTLKLLRTNLQHNQTLLNPNKISPNGLIGLMGINSFLVPKQKVGISIIGQNWNFVGFNFRGSLGEQDQTSLNQSELNELPQRIETMSQGYANFADNFNINLFDFDWEYPYAAQGYNKKETYIKILEQTRNKLNYLRIKTGKKYYLSTATTIRLTDSYTPSTLLRMSLIVDYLNLMTYGMMKPASNGVNIVGPNSKIYSMTKAHLDNLYGSNKTFAYLRDHIYATSTTASRPTRKINKKPHYGNINSVHANQNLTNISIEQSVQIVKNIGIDLKKVIIGNAPYCFMYDISSDKQGPFTDPKYYGSFTKGPVAPNGLQQLGIQSFISKIINKQAKVYFEPFLGGNYLILNNQYISVDFIESILEKRRFIKNNNLGGMMFWTINCQNSAQTNNKYINLKNKDFLIQNFPVLAASLDTISIDDLQRIWGDRLSPAFNDYKNIWKNILDKK